MTQELGKDFEILQYQQPDLNPIADRVQERIRAADYMIGIWHHEEARGGGYTISPWMPFEYGMAKALGKEVAIVFSHRLPEEIWKRIEPGFAKPSYSDLTFVTETIPTVVDYCRTNWLDVEH